jgi:AcrR family transcriptional regulator
VTVAHPARRSPAKSAERPNQRSRTRKDLLQAASRLMQQGLRPSLEEVAAEALVSRATAYRYFPKVEALLLESSLDVAVPDADQLFAGSKSTDPVERIVRVETMLHDMIVANESQLRMMLVHSLLRGDRDREGDGDVPARQNRRTPLIEAALAPARTAFRPAALDTLRKALALIIGTEGMIVCKDVLRLDDAEARRVKLWAVRALVQAARAPTVARAPTQEETGIGKTRTTQQRNRSGNRNRRSQTGANQERKR